LQFLLCHCLPRTRLSFGDRAFSVAGPLAWNSLPINVRSAQSIYSFRKLLKTYSSVLILDLNSCFNIVKRPVAFFAYFALNLSFLHDIILQSSNLIKMCCYVIEDIFNNLYINCVCLWLRLRRNFYSIRNVVFYFCVVEGNHKKAKVGCL